MKPQELLNQSEKFLQQHPHFVKKGFSLNVFSDGAQWMVDMLNKIDPLQNRTFDQSIYFTFWGWSKYLVCLLAFFISFFILLNIHFSLIPLSILAFYFIEGWFVFLFPTLIDRKSNPIVSSAKLTSEIGIFTTITTILPIAFFMLSGIFQKKKFLINWHIGCLAILFWYTDEIRNRESSKL